MKTRWTDLNLSSLKYFVDAVKKNSLTKAADENHVSRPAISQAIRRLEIQLGYDLLTHKKKHFALTPAGQSFFTQAQQAIDLLNKSFEQSLDLTSRLSIGCSATLAEHFVLPILKKTTSLKNIRTKIRIGTSHKVRQLVEEGDVTLGLLIDDERTFGFDSSVLREGHFEFQSQSGRLESPLVMTELRPEVLRAINAISSNTYRTQIESWSISRKTVESLGGTCLVPDLIPRGPLKKVTVKNFSYKYKILAITKNKKLLSPAEQLIFNYRG